MKISKVMLPIGLMTTNSETEDLSKLLLNVSDMLNLVLKPVTNYAIDLSITLLPDIT